MSPVEFYTAEAERTHEALDSIGIPRTVDGEALSMSQRVEYAVASLRIFWRMYGRQ